MDASLDTDIIIHLYTANEEALLFELFDTLYLHEYLYEKELYEKANDNVWERVEDDLEAEKIVYVDKDYLKSLGMEYVFEEALEDYALTMDDGENHAFALGKVLGCHVLLTDDTKQFGPHDLLMKTIQQETVPLAYYELYYLSYLMDDFDAGQFIRKCKQVNVQVFDHPMNMEVRMKKVLRRFGEAINKKDQIFLDQFLGDLIKIKKTKDSLLRKFLWEHHLNGINKVNPI